MTRSIAATILLTLALSLVALGSSVNHASAQIGSGSADLVAIDMDPSLSAPNTATSFDTIEPCARVNENDLLDADEDSVDTLEVDVIIDNIPPGPNPQGGLGMVAMDYRLDYPWPHIRVASADHRLRLTASGGNTIDVSDGTPDWDGQYNVSITKLGSPVPESGDGVLSRFELEADPSAGVGVFLLDVNHTLISDDFSDTWTPHVEQDAHVAIDTGCPANDGDYDDDGHVDATEQACGSNLLDSSSVPELIDDYGLTGWYDPDEDGDGVEEEALPPGAEDYDCDGDGFVGTSEAHVYGGLTDRDQSSCTNNGWPADLVSSGGSKNRLTLQDLTSFIFPSPAKFQTSPGDPGFNVRWDLRPGADGGSGGDINLKDITLLLFGTASDPPMFGGATAFNGPECSEVGPPGSPDLVAIDMDPSLSAPNTATSISTVETCARVNENDILDADEDSVDTLEVDVIVDNIPPGPNPPWGGAGMVALFYQLDYPSPDLIVASADHELRLTASSSANLDDSDPPPDSDGTYSASITKVAPSVPESGDGVLSRFELETDASAGIGVFDLDLSNFLNGDNIGEIWPALVEQDALVAIDTPCP